MKIDMWYKTGFEKGKYYADATFYPNGGGYRGNIYDSNGKTVGDYRTDDSTEIEKYFIFKWND